MAFIEKYDTYMLRISTGSISRFTDAKAYVIDANGKEFTYVADDFGTAKKIVKLDAIEHCNEVGAYIDALGQKIEEEGDLMSGRKAHKSVVIISR